MTHLGRQPPLTIQTFRDGVPHATKAYAIAKPAHYPEILKRKQSVKKTVPNSRSQEVSREAAFRSADMTLAPGAGCAGRELC